MRGAKRRGNPLGSPRSPLRGLPRDDIFSKTVMFEILINLMLASLFFNAQVDEQATLNNFTQADYHLPQAERRYLEREAPQAVENPESAGVKVTAKSALAVDAESGKILFEKNPQEVRSIASITKLMTALVFLEHNPGWDKEITMTESDFREGATSRLIVGEKVSVRDVFYTALVASANEASVALARSTGLSEEEFTKKMNDKASELGMKDTRFVDFTGLDDGNKSTAVDVAVLVKAAFTQKEILRAAGTGSYEIIILNKNISRKIVSTDWILNQTFGVGGSSYRVEAGKTGYLEVAGYSFASQITNQFGKKVIGVVLGSDTIDDRFVDTKSLAYWVYHNFEWQ